MIFLIAGESLKSKIANELAIVGCEIILLIFFFFPSINTLLLKVFFRSLKQEKASHRDRPFNILQG